MAFFFSFFFGYNHRRRGFLLRSCADVQRAFLLLIDLHRAHPIVITMVRAPSSFRFVPPPSWAVQLCGVTCC